MFLDHRSSIIFLKKKEKKANDTKLSGTLKKNKNMCNCAWRPPLVSVQWRERQVTFPDQLFISE